MNNIHKLGSIIKLFNILIVFKKEIDYLIVINRIKYFIK